jgi:hypothetical protein
MSAPYTVSKPDHKLPFWLIVDDYAFALGELCMVWSSLDHTLDEVFEALVGCEREMTTILTGNMDRLEARAILIEKMLVHFQIECELSAFVTGLMHRITKEISPLRNRYVHDRWYLAKGGMSKNDKRSRIQRSQAFHQKSITFDETELVRSSEINRLSENINTITSALHYVIIKLRVWQTSGLLLAHDTKWNPACKPRTRLHLPPPHLPKSREYPQESDFVTDP